MIKESLDTHVYVIHKILYKKNLGDKSIMYKTARVSLFTRQTGFEKNSSLMRNTFEATIMGVSDELAGRVGDQGEDAE